MKRRFFTLDVFTETRFAGNPLAVVLNADGLDDSQLQSVAREFNLSETVFVYSPDDRSHRARVRIFTPGRELPFAGHPTVGTAVLLSILDGRSGATELVLEEKVGNVRCRVLPISTDIARAEFDLPRLSAREGGAFDTGAVARALGLQATDLGVDTWPIESWSAGNAFTFVPVRGLDAIRRCRVDLDVFDDVFGGDGRAAAFLFCQETIDHGHQFHARMFAPAFGILEDPATGSAVAAFSGYLAAHGRYANAEHVFRIEQGFEMGRPSVIELRMTQGGAQVTHASIAGSAVIVSEGSLTA